MLAIVDARPPCPCYSLGHRLVVGAFFIAEVLEACRLLLHLLSPEAFVFEGIVAFMGYRERVGHVADDPCNWIPNAVGWHSLGIPHHDSM